jgi:hypothetical protein
VGIGHLGRADPARMCDRRATGRGDLLDDRRRGVAVEVVDEHCRPRVGEAERVRPTEAAPAAGDDRDLAREIERSH